MFQVIKVYRTANSTILSPDDRCLMKIQLQAPTNVRGPPNALLSYLLCVYFNFQLVWATSNRIGCAINVCYNMNVWGMIWAKAVYLVCNYSPPYVFAS